MNHFSELIVQGKMGVILGIILFGKFLKDKQALFLAITTTNTPTLFHPQL